MDVRTGEDGSLFVESDADRDGGGRSRPWFADYEEVE